MAAVNEVRTRSTELVLRVTSTQVVADDVVVVTLRDPSGEDLPDWSPGDHLELVLPSGLIRHYSLCGDPTQRNTYSIAVLRSEEGRGGSREIHDSDLVGQELVVRGPRNHFPLVDAPAYLLLAGGIGVTPVFAMARRLQERGASWQMIYGGRTESAMSFRAELAALGGDRVRIVPQDTHGLPDIAGALERAEAGTAVYCCGPDPMLRAVEELVAAHADRLTLHVERFGGIDEPAPIVDGETFEMYLADSDITLQVPADRSALDCIRDVKPDHPYSCMEGTCGSCEVAVLEGTIDHRDEVLSDAERAENSAMMTCVSRATSARIVIEL